MKRRARSLFALFALLNLAGVAQAAIPATERQVLLDLYTQTNGALWSIQTGWDGMQGTECTWFGITCDATNTHVTRIYLPLNQLSGTLPALSPLTELVVFDVDLNYQITGPIPSLSGLSKLVVFDVSGNQLTGSISSFSDLSSLERFNVSLNQLTGSIPSLSGLSNLSVFIAHDNQLTGSIPSLSGLSNLGLFDVGANRLSGSIPSLSGLSLLGKFDVDDNLLTGSIPSLSGLSNLVEFHANSNQLTGPIPSLTDAKAQLTTFLVYNNQLSGSIPSLSGFSSLTRFDVGQNRLTGSIPSLSDLSRLSYINLNSNRLTGSIPSLSGLSELSEFYVSDNQLTGSIPPIAGLTKLAWFDVSDNRLTGPAPLVDLGLTASLVRQGSRLCPNALDPAANPPSQNDSRWNYFTGTTPWSYRCTAAVVTYTVTAVATPAGTGSLTCVSPVNAGATSTCTATPNAGYVTQSIGGCGGTATASGVNSYASGAVDADCTVTASFAETPTKPVPLLAWPAPAPIVYGTALGATQLNATASWNGNPVAGTFTYTPPAGTVLNVGPNQILSATFVPSDTASYATPASPVTTTITVDAATLTPVTMTLTASPATIAQGQSVLLTATVNGSAAGATAVGRIASRRSSPSPAAVAPTGGVTFRDGGTPIGTVDLDGSGMAALSVATFAAGTHDVVATYAGDGTFAPATASARVIVTAAAAQAPMPAPMLDPLALLSLVLGLCAWAWRARAGDQANE
ncbi:MAG: Ig-like domain repeat protein [Rudaea sp.]|uniref:Ig-like domain repeat protein n=1 Tax=Rudaea sp. TaxID=2136325 RepID=UPI0039E69E9F